MHNKKCDKNIFGLKFFRFGPLKYLRDCNDATATYGSVSIVSRKLFSQNVD